MTSRSSGRAWTGRYPSLQLVEATQLVEAADRVLVLVGQEHGVEPAQVGRQGLPLDVRPAVDEDPALSEREQGRRAVPPIARVRGGADRAVAGDARDPLAGAAAEDPDAEVARVGPRVARVEARLERDRSPPGPPAPSFISSCVTGDARAARSAGGRRTTSAGPPAATRSSASLASASAVAFSLRGTCRALQRRNRRRPAIASSWSTASFASLTRQRPWICSTTSFESSSRSSSSAPSSAARSSARTTAVHSATLLVCRPSASEIVARGGASGRSAPGRSASIRAAPADAGPGFPRAAPSVRMISRRTPPAAAPLRPSAPPPPARPRGSRG